MRSASATKSAVSDVVTRSTKSTIDCLAGVSFQDESASVAAAVSGSDVHPVAPIRQATRTAAMVRIAQDCSANTAGVQQRVGIVSIMTKWTAADVPDQSGRVAVVTGSNTGIGYEAAAVLAAKGAHVVLAVRNLDKGKDAAARIAASESRRRRHAAGARPDIAGLDPRGADELRAAYPRIDLLINNAGVMYTAEATTKDGFELQFGTNHLGHFALTGLLLDNMLPVEGSRVVTISSHGHRMSRQDPLRRSAVANAATTGSAPTGSPSWPTCCSPTNWQRRLAAKGAPTIAVAAHPGGSNTELTRNLPGRIRPAGEFVWSLVTRAAEMGALPTLRAATDPAVRSAPVLRPRRASVSSAATRNSCSPAASRTTNNMQRRLWSGLRGADRRHLPGLSTALRRRTPARRRRSDHPAPPVSVAARRRAGVWCSPPMWSPRCRCPGSTTRRWTDTPSSPTTSRRRPPTTRCCCPSPRTSRPGAPTR